MPDAEWREVIESVDIAQCRDIIDRARGSGLNKVRLAAFDQVAVYAARLAEALAGSEHESNMLDSLLEQMSDQLKLTLGMVSDAVAQRDAALARAETGLGENSALRDRLLDTDARCCAAEREREELEKKLGLPDRAWSMDDAKALMRLPETEGGAVAWRYLLHLEQLLIAVQGESANIARDLAAARSLILAYAEYLRGTFPPDVIWNPEEQALLDYAAAIAPQGPHPVRNPRRTGP